MKKLHFENCIICGDAMETLKKFPEGSVDLAITSPPYWNVVDYEMEGQIGQSSYEEYIEDLLKVWKATERALAPNGKLCIVTPIMPIPKAVIKDQHTRHLKNINNDIEFSILRNTDFQRYSLFVWQKQTTTKMFGSYPYPPNIYEDNTIEFINVFVKSGKPKSVSKAVKEASKITQKEWLNLTMQIWPIYPNDVKRAKGHPAPFPIELPMRLIKMYTFKGVPEENFTGDVVLDMFAGSGTACLAAKLLGRRYAGIELNPEYCKIIERKIGTQADYPQNNLMLKPVRVSKNGDNEIAEQHVLFERAK